MKRVAVAAATLVLVFVGITLWALEAGGVAVIETRAEDGNVRSTHVWYAQPQGQLWLEAAGAGSPWLLDVRRNPSARLSVDGVSKSYTAEPADSRQAHLRIRRLLCAKYGVRDRWVDLLVDTSRSVAVRLVPAAQPKRAGSS